MKSSIDASDENIKGSEKRQDKDSIPDGPEDPRLCGMHVTILAIRHPIQTSSLKPLSYHHESL